MIPDWVMVTVWPATVRLPVRGAVPLFAAAEKLTVALPEPVIPLVIASQPELLNAVQSQAGAAAAMVTEPVVAASPNTVSEELTLKLHVTPAWVTSNGLPPITRAPIRGERLEFGATVKLTVPDGPGPDPPDATVIQLGGSAVL